MSSDAPRILPRSHALSLATLVALLLLGCNPCDRSGCDAIKQHAAQTGTGVAGAVASMDDVEENGCLLCPMSRADLSIWRVDEPIQNDEAAQDLVSARDPDVSTLADEHYFLELEVGHYLFCASRYTCIPIEVIRDETLTVNLYAPYGDEGYRVGRPDEELEDVATLRVEL